MVYFKITYKQTLQNLTCFSIYLFLMKTLFPIEPIILLETLFNQSDGVLLKIVSQPRWAKR